MRFSCSGVVAGLTAAVVAVLAAGIPHAAAQNLLDILFRNNHAGRNQREAPPAAAPVPTTVQRATPPRVSGPQYYTYKIDPLVRVDFAAITVRSTGDDDEARTVPAGVDPASVASTPVEDTGVGEALGASGIAALADFVLMAEKEIAEAIVAHYSDDSRLIWVNDGRPNDRARQALRTLGEAVGHGLDPRDYAVSEPDGTGRMRSRPPPSRWSFRHGCYAMREMRARVWSIRTGFPATTISSTSRSTVRHF